MKVRYTLTLYTLFSFFLSAYAQPLKLDWEADLLGKWQVYKMDTAIVPAEAKLFLEFLPEKVLMYNQGRIREGEWRSDDVGRKIFIKTEEGVESWDLVLLDAKHLSIFDTIGKTIVHFNRYEGEIGSTLSVKTAKANRSDLIGDWLVVSVNGQKSPVNLKITFDAERHMLLKVGQELQKATWQLDESKTKIILVPEGASPIQWVITEINSDNLSFMDQGDNMRLTRYVTPITPDKEAFILGKWKIIEVGGVMPPKEGGVRNVVFEKTGALSFYTNDKKEGEGSWGLSDTKTGIHIVSLGNTEYWRILSCTEKEMLMEIDGLRMLLKK